MKAATPSPTTVLLVTEEIPQHTDRGALAYLRPFIDYCGQRGFDLTILVTGHRFESLLLNAARIFPEAHPRLVGPDLIRLGPWSIVVGLGSWKHAVFNWLMRSGPKWLRGIALRIRTARLGDVALIGRCVQTSEVRRFARIVRAIDPDVMLVNTIFSANVLEAKPARTHSLVITHDVMHQRAASLEARGMRVAPRVSKSEEAELLNRFDAIIAISEEDAVEFRRLSTRPVHVVCPPIASRESSRSANPKHCVFIGSGSTHNVDGMAWFFDSIWPRVLAHEPQARIELIGAICNSIDAAAPAVIKHFIVEDVGPAIESAAFAINPLCAGSGLKIKMLDYLAHGLPVITTTVGATGLQRTGTEPFVVCDDPTEFAATIVSWFGDGTLVAAYAARCRDYVRAFSLDATYRALDRALALPWRLAPRSSSTSIDES